MQQSISLGAGCVAGGAEEDAGIDRPGCRTAGVSVGVVAVFLCGCGVYATIIVLVFVLYFILIIFIVVLCIVLCHCGIVYVGYLSLPL